MKRLLTRLKNEPLEVIYDLVVAHWKFVGAALTFVLVQVIDSATADWIVGALGTLFVGGKANNEAAKHRLYRKR